MPAPAATAAFAGATAGVGVAGVGVAGVGLAGIGVAGIATTVGAAAAVDEAGEGCVGVRDAAGSAVRTATLVCCVCCVCWFGDRVRIAIIAPISRPTTTTSAPIVTWTRDGAFTCPLGSRRSCDAAYPARPAPSPAWIVRTSCVARATTTPRSNSRRAGPGSAFLLDDHLGRGQASRDARASIDKACAMLAAGSDAAERRALTAKCAAVFEQRNLSASGTMTPGAAVAKAAAFLRERLRSGAYGMACVGSDGAATITDNRGHVFVAAFIAEAMTGLLDEIDRTIILVRILSEDNEGVWGYKPPESYHADEYKVFTVDSDDSAYVVRTLRRLGANHSPQCLVRFYREPERLFVTFDAPGPTSLAAEASPQNNFRAHPDVNANVFLALRGTHLEHLINYDMLRQAQDERGFWPSYFYPSPLFGTLLVLDVLHGNTAFADAAGRALAFIVDTQNSDGSWGADGDPYETALAVAALAGHEAHAPATRRGVEHLLWTMAADGSWSSHSCVWEFHAGDHDVWRSYDRHRVYVTARCMTALRRAAGQLAPFPC